MSRLPPGVAAILANMDDGPVILYSDGLSSREKTAARLVACYKAIEGAPVVFVLLREVCRALRRVA